MRQLFLVLALVGCGTKGEDDAIDCDTLSLELPPAVSEPTGVWDADRSRLVFFGGDIGAPVNCQAQTSFTGDTWAFYPECGAFAKLDTAGPSPRGRQASAHDVAGGRMIIHGGRTRAGTEGSYTQFDDTWSMDLATDAWTRLSESGPGIRVNHSLVVAGDRLILFGGNNSPDGASYSPLGDVWQMDMASGVWSELPTTNPPSARLFHAYTVSDDGATMWVYGGTSNFFGPFLGDLYALDLASGAWTLASDGSGGPAARFWGNMVHDSTNNRLLLWAGHDDTDLGNTNELWVYDLAQGIWARAENGDLLTGQAAGFCDFPADFVTPDLEAPERRNGGLAVMAGDELRIFGGEADCGQLNDVWAWTSETGWSVESRSTAGEICLRTAASGCTTMCF